jgi:O-antigen/teichoic acid export membrane protein
VPSRPNLRRPRRRPGKRGGRLRGLSFRWWHRELRSLTGDTFYVGIWQAATSLTDLAQIALVTGFLGLTDYGRLALVSSLVMLVGKFFDVRVGVAATTLGASAMRQSPARGAAVFRLSYAIDAATGVLSVVALIPVALLVGEGLIGSDGVLLVLLYSIVLLVGTVNESSLTVLRLLDRYRLIAAFTIPLQALRVGLVLAALIVTHSLIWVVVALVVAEAALALAQLTAAAAVFQRHAGRRLFSRHGAALPTATRRQMLRTVLQTNIFTYAQLTQQQLPAVVLGAISGPLEAGVYKIGMAVSILVGRLADPARVSILPRLARLWADGRMGQVWRLLRSAALIAVPVMVVTVGLVIVFRDALLEVLGGQEATTAGAVVVLCSIAWGIDGALFWNTGLRFVAGEAKGVARVAAGAAAIQIAILVPMVDATGASGAALAFLISVAVANALNTAACVRIARRPPSASQQGSGRGVDPLTPELLDQT